jgi:hypothetical protein
MDTSGCRSRSRNPPPMNASYAWGLEHVIGPARLFPPAVQRRASSGSPSSGRRTLKPRSGESDDLGADIVEYNPHRDVANMAAMVAATLVEEIDRMMIQTAR